MYVVCRDYISVFSPVKTCQQVCNKINTMDVNCGATTDYHSEVSEYTAYNCEGLLLLCIVLSRSVFYIIVCLFALILDGQSSIQREFEPDFVNNKVDQLLVHGRWFSASTPGFFHR